MISYEELLTEAPIEIIGTLCGSEPYPTLWCGACRDVVNYVRGGNTDASWEALDWMSTVGHPIFATYHGHIVSLTDWISLPPLTPPLPEGSHDPGHYTIDDHNCPRCGKNWHDGNHHRHHHRWACRNELLT